MLYKKTEKLSIIKREGEIMGMFVNPNAAAFQCAVNSEVYIDKTGLLEYTNKVLGTNARFICNSRPRRFGKSVTVDMLTAYYSKGCDTEKMFSGLEISKCPDFYEHLNKYDVIHFDVQWCCISAGSSENLISYITNIVVSELRETYPEVNLVENSTIYGAMARINTVLGKQFIVIIDEWDVLIRDEAHNQAAQEMYIDFLRNMFKGIEASKYIALAYLTGILPIKKLKTQSALNNFTQFTMLNAGPLTPYIGFNEDEVIDLCEKYEIDFAEVRRWYDGYRLGDYHVYNPNALVNLTIMRTFQSYWSQTGTYLSILPLINMDFDGLRTSIIEMLSGSSVEVNVNEFQNDMVSFADKDDVLTLLIHLGYLAYDQRTQRAYIPNEEIRQEFRAATKRNKWNELIEFQQESEKLLEATWEMDAETVAEQIEKIHAEVTTVYLWLGYYFLLRFRNRESRSHSRCKQIMSSLLCALVEIFRKVEKGGAPTEVLSHLSVDVWGETVCWMEQVHDSRLCEKQSSALLAQLYNLKSVELEKGPGKQDALLQQILECYCF